MRIELKTTNPDRAIVLGDDGVREFIRDWRPVRQCLVDPTPYLRATWQDIWERNNRIISFAWATARQHSSHAAALTFIRDHLLTVPDSGTVVIQHLGANSGALWLPAAVLTELRIVEHYGRHTLIAYTATGGQLYAHDPT